MTVRARIAAASVLVTLVFGTGSLAFAETPPQSAPAASPPATPAAQAPAAPGSPAPAPPAARPEDVASMDAIVAALYDVISGPAGAKRNWDRFRSLFAPGAHLIPIARRPGTPAQARMLTPDDYIARASSRLEQDGFFEREIASRVEMYGALTHVFSTYESRHARDEEKPFARGINSIQLLNDGTRWWIVNVYWQGEAPDLPLPEKYLPGK